MVAAFLRVYITRTVYKQYSEPLRTDCYRFESQRIGIASLMYAVFSPLHYERHFLNNEMKTLICKFVFL